MSELVPPLNAQANSKSRSLFPCWLFRIYHFLAFVECRNQRVALEREVAVENLAIVSKRANQNENEKVRITENLNELTIVLNRLVEKLDEDRSIKDHLITISSILKNLGDQNTDKISEFESNLTLELRAISKQLSDIEKSTNKLNNKWIFMNFFLRVNLSC